jgi:hypothetical protein
MKRVNVLICVASVTLFLGGGFLVSQVKNNKVSAKQSQVKPEVKQRDSVPANQFEGIPISHNMSVSKSYESVEELEQEADVILIGKPTMDIAESKPKSKIVPIGKRRDRETTDFARVPGESYVTTMEDGGITSFFSLATIKVQKVIKGDIKTKTIDVSEPAALVQASDNSRYIIASEDYTPLQKNTKYLLFLTSTDILAEKHADLFQRFDYKNELPGKYTMLTAVASKFNLDGSDKAEEKQFDDPMKAATKLFRDKVSKKYRADYDSVTQ